MNMITGDSCIYAFMAWESTLIMIMGRVAYITPCSDTGNVPLRAKLLGPMVVKIPG